MIDVIVPLEIFSNVNRELHRVVYQVELVSCTQGALIGSSGLPVVPSRCIYDRVAPVDLLLVVGSPNGVRHMSTRDEVAWITSTAERATRLGAIGTGAALLEQARLLDDLGPPYDHSQDCDRLKLIGGANAILITGGAVSLFPGIDAGVDLALAITEQDCGAEVACAAARDLVVYLKC